MVSVIKAQAQNSSISKTGIKGNTVSFFQMDQCLTFWIIVADDRLGRLMLASEKAAAKPRNSVDAKSANE
jgi:hypothetical protein